MREKRYCGGVHRFDSGSLSKLTGAVRRPSGSPSQGWLLAGVMAPTAWLLAACGSGADLMSSVALPSQQTANIIGGDGAVDAAASPGVDAESGLLEVTQTQRAYLDALTASGIHPSSELRALSIGSYVCQARAAGRNDRGVWDYVAPMVRSDVSDARAAIPQLVAAPQSVLTLTANTAIADYIRIATERLC